MPWVKFSDDWYDDPELIEAGPAAMLVWPLLISWSARNLQDGKIPAGQVRRLVDWHSLGVDPEQAIAPLVANGRLQEIAGGYLITNYHRYQPSREKVLADREAAKERAAKSRKRAANVRDECADGAPPPVPVPDRPLSSSSEMSAPGLPEDLWMKIAEKRYANASNVINASAWKRKAAENARIELGDRAVALVRDFDLSTAELIDVLLSGSTPQWLAHKRRKDAS